MIEAESLSGPGPVPSAIGWMAPAIVAGASVRVLAPVSCYPV